MRILNRITRIGAMSLLLSDLTFAADSTIDWRYRDAQSGDLVTSEVLIPSALTQDDLNPSLSYSDVNIKKTLFTKDLGLTIQKAVNDYQECIAVEVPENDFPVWKKSADSTSIAIDRCYRPTMVDDSMPGIYYCPWIPDRCTEHRLSVANQLDEDLENLKSEFFNLPKNLHDSKLIDTLDLTSKLVGNMKNKANEYAYDYYSYGLENGIRLTSPSAIGGGGSLAASAMSKGLNVTAGGAQDFGFIRKQIEDGLVPQKNALVLEGFLSEFDLSLTNMDCDQLICIQPATAINQESSELFVQIAMNSNVTAESFKRANLNMSMVIDISGSMSSDDNTNKTRLEWAKEAALHTIKQMTEDDYLSIVVFETESEIIQKPVVLTAANRVTITNKIAALTTKGSTNLEAGLRDGYTLTSTNYRNGYENRVILISDAGLNTGATDDATLLKLVTDFASEDIGLTAIGLGLNFNQDFIRHISQSKGGNYIFVHSGREMYQYFENFDFLVTPVAYSFKATVDLQTPANLIETYGVPMPKEVSERAFELIDIQTLFFAGSSGGAIILEYNLLWE